MRLSYFPGCSLAGTAAEYDRSIRAVAAGLGVELVELADWSCCGASSAHMTDAELGIALAARNLQLAAAAGLDLLVPCAACFQRLRVADRALRAEPRRWGLEAWQPDFAVIHLTRWLAQRERLAQIGRQIARPLAGLRLACYYGCLSLRPAEVTGAPDAEQPEGLDRLVAALGAEPVRWSHKTECCSGSLTMARPDIARALIGDLLAAARRGGARAIVTDCPMCQANLESRQLDLLRAGPDADGLPVFFATELVAHALAAGEARKPWREHLVDPRPLLGELKL
jgi:heterodisulfide reductase subunit B